MKAFRLEVDMPTQANCTIINDLRRGMDMFVL